MVHKFTHKYNNTLLTLWHTVPHRHTQACSQASHKIRCFFCVHVCMCVFLNTFILNGFLWQLYKCGLKHGFGILVTIAAAAAATSSSAATTKTQQLHCCQQHYVPFHLCICVFIVLVLSFFICVVGHIKGFFFYCFHIFTGILRLFCYLYFFCRKTKKEHNA